MLSLDLGCGTVKQIGFLGLDRSPMPGVDLVVDLDGTLPIQSDSVDLVYASHSLEHVVHLMHTMREIYRVCRHGAQVCILAPYFEQKLNLANNYHLQAFNEHTPRFWSASKTAHLSRDEYWHPHATDWGLSESDHSDPGIDFRLIRMEMFYFPGFLHASDEERLFARRSLLDVCDQVMYHLIVWKAPEGTEQDVQDAIASIDLFIPDQVVARRAHDAERKAHAKADRPDALNWPSIFRQGSAIAQQKSEIAALQLHAAHRDCTIDELRAQIERMLCHAQASERKMQQLIVDAAANAQELASLRRQKSLRVANWLCGHEDVRAALPAPFAPLLADFGPAVRVVIGKYISDAPFVAYRVDIPQELPWYFDVAIHSPVRTERGSLGLEIVSLRGQIVSHQFIKIGGAERFGLYRFPVDLPVECAGQAVEVRLFSSQARVPMYTLECRRRWARPRSGRLLGAWIGPAQQ